MFRPAILRLKGAVQHYEWGGHRFIPRLLGIENKDSKPFAELWIGAHPKAPSTVEIGGRSVPLNELVKDDPGGILGPPAAEMFEGRLPYLFKVLDARNILSIQAHPNRQQAREGFARENADGISLDAPHRNYRDDNHKPEVHVALTEFWMLHGFRPLEEIATILHAVPEFRAVMVEFDERLLQAGQNDSARRELLRDLYSAFMSMPQEQVDGILDRCIGRLESGRPTEKTDPDFWALQAAREFPLPGGHRDRGIFSVYLLNLVHLRPGQGTFQDAGVLHAYLEGVDVELMANSDNVLRGGLTPKHVDVPELMRTLSFRSSAPAVLGGDPVSACERVYRTSAREFELSRIQLVSGTRYQGKASFGPDSIILLDGSATVSAQEQTLLLNRGDIIFVPYGLDYAIETESGSAVLFKAAIPAPPE